MRGHCPPEKNIRNSNPGLGPSTLSLGHAGSQSTEFHEWMVKKHFCFFLIVGTEKRTSNSSVKGTGANYYPRAPAYICCIKHRSDFSS